MTSSGSSLGSAETITKERMISPTKVFDRFSMDRRVNVDDQHLQWEVLGDLMVESANLYKEITERKKLQRGGEHGSPKSGKKKAKFFKRWSS